MSNSVQLYAIRTKSGFSDPVSFATELHARGSFSALCQSLLANGLEYMSYDLFRVGDFDVSTGHISSFPPEFITSGYAENVNVKKEADTEDA